MIKGFALNDERLSQGKTAFGKDYFKELIERVRSIRTSGRRIWQQILQKNTWDLPRGRILKSDVTVAKNYLSEKEIRKLERAVSGFFDHVEDIIEDENIFTMEEFVAAVDDFLNFKRYTILQDKGKMRKKVADNKAKSEYDIFNKTQSIESDFDKQINKLAICLYYIRSQ